jgi:hypothetical protein
MSRKNNLILQQSGYKSFSRAIRDITGWDVKKFETEKRLMRYRVSNLNKLTGANLSPIEELYYRVKREAREAYYKSKGQEIFAPSPIQKALAEIKTTKVNVAKVSARQDAIAKKYVQEKFEGFGRTYKQAGAILERLKNGEISAKEANKMLADYANKMKVLKREDPLTWATMQDEEIGSP